MLKPELGVNLAKYSTLGVGGKADFLVTATKSADLIAALDWAAHQNLPFLVLGNGSNVLISDEGFRGLVVINRVTGCKTVGNKVVAESGEGLSRIARESLNNGLIGLHFAASIPGTVGGAVAVNAGALGWDISKTFVSAEVWEAGKVLTWTVSDFNFDYRYSSLKGKSEAVILSTVFELAKGDTESLITLLEEDKARRLASYIGRTCGSYFKNPPGISAGELIDSLGLKGYRVGGAEVSPFHANVLRNAGDASAADFLALEEYIIQKAEKECGVTLSSEVVKIGF